MDIDRLKKQPVMRKLTAFLYENGYRQSSERYVILHAIGNIGGHFDIDMLYSYIETEMQFHVCRATLYNNIGLLVGSGLVIRHPGKNPAIYERGFSEMGNDKLGHGILK